MRAPVLILSLFLAATVYGQPVTFGVKAGVPLGDAYSSDSFTKVGNSRWTVGPTVEVRLPARFAIGFDALYQPYDYQWNRNVGSASFSATGTASRWELPLYLKYRFSAADNRIQPFISGGVVAGVSRTSESYQCSGDPQLCGTPLTAKSDSSRWGSGVVASGGVEFHKFRLKFAPEVRYTHWGRGLLAPKSPDQVSLLLGIRF